MYTAEHRVWEVGEPVMTDVQVLKVGQGKRESSWDLKNMIET